MSAAPELAPDPPTEAGLLGPDSVAWKVIGHPASLVGGLRSLMVQALHPLAMAGVAQHSNYRDRPLDRLQRTSHYVAATLFGDEHTARRAAARVNKMHERVKGTDPVTGRPYSAADPDTQLWVHVAEWHSFLAAYRAFGGRLSADEQDRYHAEGVRIATLLKVRERDVPDSVGATRDYFERMRPQLCVSEASRDAFDIVLHPPASDRTLLALNLPLRLYGSAALALVPRHLRAMAGVDRPRAVDRAAIAALWPAITALRAPGVRELPGLLLGAETREVSRQAMRRRAEAQRAAA